MAREYDPTWGVPSPPDVDRRQEVRQDLPADLAMRTAMARARTGADGTGVGSYSRAIRRRPSRHDRPRL